VGDFYAARSGVIQPLPWPTFPLPLTLFPSRNNPEKPFSGWSKTKARFDAGLPFSDYTLHDLRRTFSSNLARMSVPIHVTEKLLNHTSGTI
jgi:integrase